MPIKGNDMGVDRLAAARSTEPTDLPVDIPEDREELLQRLRESRDTVPNQAPPAGPTERQWKQTQAEMEAGKRRSAYFAEQQAKQKQLVDAKEREREGSSEPVHVSGDYQHEKGNATKGASTGKL